MVVEPGDRIHFLDWGGEGTPGLLLIHGLSNTAWSWAPVARRAIAARHVVAMDLRGHGLSDAPTGGLRARPAGRGRRRGRGGIGPARPVATERASSSPAMGSGPSSPPGPPRRSGRDAPGSSSSMAAGRTSKSRPAWTPTSSCAASTSRPRSCGRSTRSWRIARPSTRRPGTTTRTARREPPSSRRMPGKVVPATRPHALEACVRTMFDYDPERTLAAIEAPVVALLAADDETGSRAKALARADDARSAAGRSTDPARVVRARRSQPDALPS